MWFDPRVSTNFDILLCMNIQAFLGACLLGSVLTGIAFWWSAHVEAIQWTGAALCGAGYLCYKRFKRKV